jgi:hypothetical protein
MKHRAQLIEENKEKRRKAALNAAVDAAKRLLSTKPKRRTGERGKDKKKRQVSQKSIDAIAPFKWAKGQSGNPGGRPKDDISAGIARAILAGNQEAIYKALTDALLRGNAYVFDVLANRGYGKIKETISYEHSGTIRHDIASVDARILELVAGKPAA